MAYAATPAAAPAADAPAPAYEGKAPPTIDSHGGKLTPVTCFCAGPDGPTSLLMMLALLLTLAPRGIKAFGRAVDLSALRLAPGLLLTGLLAWNMLPSLDPPLVLPEQFHLVAPVKTGLGLALLAVSFLRLLSDALMPVTGRSRARSVAAMAAAGLAVAILPLALGVNIYWLMEDGALSFRWAAILGGYLGFPAGLALLLAWRRFDGRLFDVLLLIGTVTLVVLGGTFLSGVMNDVIVFLVVSFTVAAVAGAGLRGMGLVGWQGLTGRMAWVLGWISLILVAMGITMWLLY